MEQATKPQVREAELAEVFWAAALAFCEDHGITTSLRIREDSTTRIDSHDTGLRVGLCGETMREQYNCLIGLKNVCEQYFEFEMTAACTAIGSMLMRDYRCISCGKEFNYVDSAVTGRTISCPHCKAPAYELIPCEHCGTKTIETLLDDGNCPVCHKEGDSDD